MSAYVAQAVLHYNILIGRVDDACWSKIALLFDADYVVRGFAVWRMTRVARTTHAIVQSSGAMHPRTRGVLNTRDSSCLVIWSRRGLLGFHRVHLLGKMSGEAVIDRVNDSTHRLMYYWP